MKTFGSVVFGLVLSLASSLCLASEKTLNIVADNYPPYYGEDLPNGGVLTEIIVEAFRRAGYELKIKWVPWKRAVKGGAKARRALQPLWATNSHLSAGECYLAFPRCGRRCDLGLAGQSAALERLMPCGCLHLHFQPRHLRR